MLHKEGKQLSVGGIYLQQRLPCRLAPLLIIAFPRLLLVCDFKLFSWYWSQTMSTRLTCCNWVKIYGKKTLSAYSSKVFQWVFAVEGQLPASKTVDTLQWGCFSAFWKKLLLLITSQDVDEPILPHKRKQPCRYEEGKAPYEYDPSPTHTYRRIYYEAVDLLIQAINGHSDRPGYNMYCCL